jgi:hypothetical protein
MRRPDPDQVVKAWRNSSHNTIGQVIHETAHHQRRRHVTIEPQIDRNTAKRDINIAGFGLFNTHEIVAGVMRNQGLTLEAALTKYGLPRPAGCWRCRTVQQGRRAAGGQRLAARRWRDAFQQCTVPGVMIRTDPINKVTIDGVQQRCTLIVLDRYHAAPEK